MKDTDIDGYGHLSPHSPWALRNSLIILHAALVTSYIVEQT